MSTYTIGEVAERSGFSAPALRYYQSIGLVVPSARTGGGYRVYDDQTLARLAFIARAKQLGCSLKEITELAAIWDGERCGPVQHHLRDLVTAKISEAGRQIGGLAALTDQLRAAADHLGRPAIDGPCDDTCACASSPMTVGPTAMDGGAKPGPPPIGCTLDAGAMPDRVSDWHRISAAATTRQRCDHGSLRMVFADTALLGEIGRLVAAEQACCAFLTFVITVDYTGITLDIQAPAGGEALMVQLLVAPA